jgi:biopolymer transport protein TolQ
VSGALLTTVVGLVVALPSMIGYNILVGRIRALALLTERFVEEFLSDLDNYFAET